MIGLTLAMTLAAAPVAPDSELKLVDQFIAAVEADDSDAMDGLLTPGAYYHQMIGRERSRSRVDSAPLSTMFKAFNSFAAEHNIVKTEERPESVRLVWDCEHIDPPSCTTEFFFEDGKIREVSHMANPMVVF